MEYETWLPATHLRSERLVELEELLCADATDPDLSVVLEYESVTYAYESARELVNNIELPEVVRTFRVVMSAEEGSIHLVAGGGEGDLVLRITGEESWGQSRRRDVEQFFRSHGSMTRTLLEQYLGLGLATAVVVISLGLYYGGLGEIIGMSRASDAFFFGALTVFLGGLLHVALNVVYPYTLVVSDHYSDRPFLYTNT